MPTLTSLENYSDDQGNEVIFEGSLKPNIQIYFGGSNNKLIVDATARIAKLNARFDCNNGTLQIGGNTTGVAPLMLFTRTGEDSHIVLGSDVSTTALCMLSAVEGTSLVIGDDVMIASENDLRTDDGHPIFDIVTEKRVNPARSIKVGNHVWIGRRATVLGGSDIGDGSVIGFGSLVKGHIPNNCIAAGTPAKVLRRNIAWERPHLSLAKPPYKPDASTVKKSEYWHPTEGTPMADESPVTISFYHNNTDYSVDFPTAEEARSWYNRVTDDGGLISQKLTLDEADQMLFGSDTYDESFIKP